MTLLLISPLEYIYYMILAFPPSRRDIQIFRVICFVLEHTFIDIGQYHENEILHYGYLSPFNGAVGKSNSCENVQCLLYDA